VDIYLTKDGKQLGPYTFDEARRQRDSGAIKDSDFAWHEGLAQWTPLAQIAGFNLSPTGLPPGPPIPPPIGASQRGDPTGMRIVTAVVIFGISFIVLFCVVALVALMIGGAISGAQAAIDQNAQGFNQGQAVGQEAGEKFGKEYGPLIFGCSALFSLVASGVVAWLTSFSNLFPWCRVR
jgi:hypothetical protein